jgi:hypothetical protein
MAMADDYHAPLPLRSGANCAMSSSISDPPPPSLPEDSNNHATLDAQRDRDRDRDRDRRKAELAQERKQNLELKAARAKEYEERWHERCAQDVSEDSWAAGWKQPLVQEEYGGWDYAPAPAAETSSLLGMHAYPSWKRKLHSEQLDRNYGGWDQPLPSSSEDAPLGGWLYPDPSEPLDDYQTEVEILGKKVHVFPSADSVFVLSSISSPVWCFSMAHFFAQFVAPSYSITPTMNNPTSAGLSACLLWSVSEFSCNIIISVSRVPSCS